MSWIELSVAAVVLSLVFILFVQRLEWYQERAERADMEYAVATFRAALRIQVSLLMVDGRLGEKKRLLCENPVNWLEQPPANYAGEAHGAAVRGIAPGRWYFDREACSMGYLVEHGAHFVPDREGLRRVRFAVRGDGRNAAESPGALAFMPLEPYQWAE